jgi:hypothetical protein
VFLRKPLVELGRIELPSAKRNYSSLRPFPRFQLYGCRTAGSVWCYHPPPSLSLMSAVFPAVSGLSRRHPLLLLPGCKEQAPCAISGHCDSFRPLSGCESEAIVGFYFLSPFNESETTRVARNNFRSQRRNRSAPYVKIIIPHLRL